MKHYLGIDLGGTNVRVAKVTEDGQILQEIKAPSFASESAEVILENVFKQIDAISDLDTISGIGFAVPGPVDQEKGWMNMASNIPALKHFPLVERVKSRYNIDVVMDNDANVAGLAEALVGAGKGYPIVAYITLSTGIGAGIVINGQTISGKNGYAGEIGNIIVDATLPKLNHLNHGAVENEASGTALVRKARARIDENIVHAGQLFDLVKEGHEEAIKIKNEMINDLSIAFSAVAHVLDPHVFVLGGGVMKSADVFLDEFIESYKERVHTQMRNVEFKKAQLNEPGIIGAAMLPKSKGY